MDWACRLLLLLDFDLLLLLLDLDFDLLPLLPPLDRELRVDLDDATLLSELGRARPLDLDRRFSPPLDLSVLLSDRLLGSRLPRELGSKLCELDAPSDLSFDAVGGRSFLRLLLLRLPLRRLPVDSALLLEPKLWSNLLASSSFSSSSLPRPKRSSSSSVSSSSSSRPSDMNLPRPLLWTRFNSSLRQSGQAFMSIFQPGPKSRFLRKRTLGWWMQYPCELYSMTCLGLAAVDPKEVVEAFIPELAEQTEPFEEERLSLLEGRRSAMLLLRPPREPLLLPVSLLPLSLPSRSCRLPVLVLSRLPSDRPVL